MIELPPPESLGLVVLGGVFVLSGLFLRLRSRWRIGVAIKWPVVTGTVVSAAIGRETTKQFVAYQAIVAYNYRVDGQDLTGGRIWLIDDGKRGRSSDAEADMDRYRPGAVVAVHYDPAMPGRSCLVIDGPLRGALYVIAVGVAVAAAALLMPSILGEF